MISVLAPGALKTADFASAFNEVVREPQAMFFLPIKNGGEMSIETF